MEGGVAMLSTRWAGAEGGVLPRPLATAPTAERAGGNAGGQARKAPALGSQEA